LVSDKDPEKDPDQPTDQMIEQFFGGHDDHRTYPFREEKNGTRGSHPVFP
jgi:hypothetical protein